MSPTRDLLNFLNGINNSLSDVQSLERMALRANSSKFHLHRKLRRLLGETPKKYISRLRLQRAAAQLATTNKSILAIALESGFQSHEVFSRAFKRQFGLTPRNYRERQESAFSKTEAANYQRIVKSVAPCTNLYRISSKNHGTVRNMPIESIQLKHMEAQPILFIQRRVSQNQLQPNMAECFGTLFSYGVQSGLAIAGQPIARYVTTGPGLWTVDFILPLSKVAEGINEMQAGFLSEGPVVVAIHKGPYEELSETNAAVHNWIEQNGHSPNGPPWESYVTSPAEVPDPIDWITEVHWPVSEKAND